MRDYEKEAIDVWNIMTPGQRTVLEKVAARERVDSRDPHVQALVRAQLIRNGVNGHRLTATGLAVQNADPEKIKGD